MVALTRRPGSRLVRFQPCSDSAKAWARVEELTERRATRPSFFTSSTCAVTYWPTFSSVHKKTRTCKRWNWKDADYFRNFSVSEVVLSYRLGRFVCLLLPSWAGRLWFHRCRCQRCSRDPPHSPHIHSRPELTHNNNVNNETLLDKNRNVECYNFLNQVFPWSWLTMPAFRELEVRALLISLGLTDSWMLGEPPLATSSLATTHLITIPGWKRWGREQISCEEKVQDPPLRHHKMLRNISNLLT